MATNDYFSLVAKLEAQDFPEVVYLFGDEPYLANDALARLKATVVSRAKDFNFSEHDCKDALVSLVAAARMLPMMAERRLVIGQRADEVRAGDIEPLLTYLAAPSPSTVLVLVARSLDSRTKLAKALSARGALFQCQALKRPQLVQFVNKRAAALGLELDAGVADLLYEAYAADLSQWVLALERFMLYMGGPGAVTQDVAEALVSRTRAESIFALTDAVLSGRTEVALPLSESLLAQKEAPLAMVGLCARQIRQLLIVREALDGGKSAREAAAVASLPPFLADKYVARAKASTLAALTRALMILSEADQRLKSSPLDGSLVWFSALWDVMRKAASA